MRQALTIDKAIKIFKEPGRIGYQPLTGTTEEETQYNIDSEMALMMALVSMEKLNLINYVVDNKYADVEEKYEEIVKILNKNQEV